MGREQLEKIDVYYSGVTDGKYVQEQILNDLKTRKDK